MAFSFRGVEHIMGSRREDGNACTLVSGMKVFETIMENSCSGGEISQASSRKSQQAREYIAYAG